MNITKELYNGYITPLINQIYEISKNLSLTEEIIILDKVINILQSEYELENLYNELTNFSPLQTEILKKYNLKFSIDKVVKIIQKSL